MIKKSRLFGNKTADAPAGTVSVVGTFNGWEPGTHELKPRRNGTRTVSVPLGPGQHSFRYLASDGVWLDDEFADAVGPQGSELRL
jgi:1,4-alpha-glucan branching enzyme